MKRTSLFLTVMLALTGLVAATGAAHADDVQITGPASVQVGTQFDYTVAVAIPGVLGLSVELSGSPATFTDVSSNDLGMSCSFSNFEATCSPVGNGPAGNFEITLTVLPTQAGIVTATAEAPGPFIFDPDGGGSQFIYVDSTPTTIVAPPTVTGVSPASGTTAGGTSVTITGTNLTGATAITFGTGNNATGVSCTATSCTVTTPAASAGTVDVRVTTPGGTSANSAADNYTYVTPVADLEVTLDASSSILLTSRVVYTAHAFNNGPATSPGSTVTTHLSSAALSVNAGSGCTLSSGHQDVTCPVGSLASGSGANATFTVTFPLLTINLALNATATIAGTGTTDPTSGNNTDSATCLAVTSVLIVCP